MPTTPKAPEATPQDTPLTPAERQINRAKVLEWERQELMERIGKNRDYLRLMDSNEELTDEQGQWLDAFYPVKEKGEQRDKDAIEATRKAKDAAYKEVAALKKSEGAAA